MLTATVTHIGGTRAVVVHLSGDDSGTSATTTPTTTPTTSVNATGAAATATTEAEKLGPSPIVPEVKEIVWTSGAFVVFAVLMRYFLYPRLRKGMDARYNSIRADHEGADATRSTARAEVADYEAQLAGVKAEAALKIDAARRTLEAERAERLVTVNAELATVRAAAASDAETARAAVQSQIESAVADVASRAIELAIGQTPNPDIINRVVGEVMSVGAAQ